MIVGDKKRGMASKCMEEMELEITRWSNVERSLLHGVGSRGFIELRQSVQFKRETFVFRKLYHHVSWCT